MVGAKPRLTRQRSAVADVLADIDDFRSAQEIHATLRSRDASVGLTTVYRTLQSLAEAGEVDAIRTDEGETVYRRCETSQHHHHIVCRHCGRTVEVENPAVERWAEQVASDAGFVDVTHTVEVFGTCGSCAEQARAEAGGR
ncbi:MAG TPA: transcriptional repressor [Actinopolymorphaceae bacterium]